jgi:hypothetical protein
LLRQFHIPEDLSLERFAAIHTDLVKIAQNPTTFAMVQIYWFFCSGCNLTGHDSEVRVALIRNAFWAQVGIPAVTYRESYTGDQSRGCDAVKQAVHRFRWPQGTAR